MHIFKTQSLYYIANNYMYNLSSFPKDEIRRKQWTDALALYNWTPVKKSVVCSKHFLDTQFVNDASRNRKLMHSAVPCVFPKPDFDMRRVNIIYYIILFNTLHKNIYKNYFLNA